MRSTNVAVAEWLRRQTVNLSMRVQFPPATPSVLKWIARLLGGAVAPCKESNNGVSNLWQSRKV